MLHKHVWEWEAERTFCGVIVGSLSADPIRPSLRSTTAQTEQMRVVADIEIIKSVYKRMNYVHLISWSFDWTLCTAMLTSVGKCNVVERLI